MKNILLVEDSTLVVNIVSDTFKRRWLTIDIAQSLESALDKLTSSNYDVVITDTSLTSDPFSSEWLEVAKAFKSINSNWILIAMSWMERKEWIEWKNCLKFIDKLEDWFAAQIVSILTNLW